MAARSAGRRLLCVVAAFLGVLTVFVPASVNAAEIGTFGFWDGPTIYAVNSPNMVTVYGDLPSTTSVTAGDFVTTFDGVALQPTFASKPFEDGSQFSETFTDPEAQCGINGFTKHTVGVSFKGTALPSQPLTFRCASDYVLHVEPNNAQSSYVGGVDWLGSTTNPASGASTPQLAVCLDAVDHGVTFGQVPLTQPNFAGMIGTTEVSANVGGREVTAEELRTLRNDGRTASRTATDTVTTKANDPECLGIDHQGTEADNAGTIMTTATLAGSQNDVGVISGSYTADIVAGDLVNVPQCLPQGVAIPVTGTRWLPGSYVKVDYVFEIFNVIKGRRTAKAVKPKVVAGSPVQVLADGTFSYSLDAPDPNQGTLRGVDVSTSPTANGTYTDAVDQDVNYNCDSTRDPVITVTPTPFAATTGSRHIDVTGQNFNGAACEDGMFCDDSTLEIDIDDVPQVITSGSNKVDDSFSAGVDWMPTPDDPTLSDCSTIHILSVTTTPPPELDEFPITVQEPLQITCPSLTSIPDDGTPRAGPDGEDEVNVGDSGTVTAKLSGFDPDRAVTVALGTDASRNETRTDQVDGTGSNQVVVSAAAVPCGTAKEITATQENDTASYSVPPTATGFEVAHCSTEPSVSLAPTSFAISPNVPPVSISGDGLRPGATYNAIIDNAAGSAGSVTADVTGSIEGFQVPVAGLGCGQHAVTLTPADATLGDDPASLAFTVTCPVAIVTPATVNPDSPPDSFTVTSTGFDPSGKATVSIPHVGELPADVFQGQVGTLTSTGNAVKGGVRPKGVSFTPGIVLPLGAEEELPCGTTMVTITETGTAPETPPTAQTPITVNCPVGMLTSSLDTIATTSGNRFLRVNGSGWKPGSSLPIDYDGAVIANAPVDAAGGFDVTLTLPAPTPGIHTIDATQPPYRHSASVLVLVTQPTLTTSVPGYSQDTPPSSFDLTGGGYDANTPVTVAVPGGNDLAVVTNATGGFTVSVPTATVPCGSLTVAATEPVTPGGPFTVGPTSSAPLAVTCKTQPVPVVPTPPVPTGTLTVNPGTISYTGHGRPITLSGSGFPGNIPVVLTGDGIPSTTVTTNGSGGFSVPVVETGACGSHPLTATPSKGSAVGSSYSVTCPLLTSNPATFNGLDLPATTSVTGSGYDPNSTVAVVLEQTGETAVTVTGHADATGAFTVPMGTTNLVCGTAPIVGTEKVAANTPAPTASAVDTVTCEAPVVTVSPTVVPAGSVAVITGQNFHPGETVTLSWKLADGSPALGDCGAIVAKDDSFTASCLVFDHDVTGPRNIVAVDQKGTGGSGAALVVENPTEPGRVSPTAVKRSLLSRR